MTIPARISLNAGGPHFEGKVSRRPEHEILAAKVLAKKLGR
jgi:hypothetical protein